MWYVQPVYVHVLHMHEYVYVRWGELQALKREPPLASASPPPPGSPQPWAQESGSHVCHLL